VFGVLLGRHPIDTQGHSVFQFNADQPQR
jgi:hypothetical protein